MTTKKPKKSVSFLLAASREIGAAEFKAHCLEIMDEVERRGIEVTITKHRRPVARLVPARSPGAFCGSMKGSILWEGDLIGPIDIEWEAEQ